jgi:hypothetical protein
MPLDTPSDPLPDNTSADCSEGDLALANQSRLISRVLTPAIRLWLRSQLDQVEDLQFKVDSGDRQLLSGVVRHITLSAHKAVYQGIHLSQIQLMAEHIRTNLGQVLRGQPFQLLQPFPVTGRVILTEADLNTSLSAPLLSEAVTEFVLKLLPGFIDPGDRCLRLLQPQLQIRPNGLKLGGLVQGDHLVPTPIAIQTGVQLQAGRLLVLDQPQRLDSFDAHKGIPLPDLHGFAIDLGSEVNLQSLVLESGQILCQGTVTVLPDPLDEANP